MNLVTSTDQFLSGSLPFVGATSPGPGPAGEIMEWARRQVEKVRAAAHGGRFRYAPPLDDLTEETPEIRAAYPVMLKDGPIKAGLLTKVLAVSQLPLQVHAKDEANPRDQECAEFIRYALDKIESAQNWMGVPGIAWNVLGPACVQGVSIANKVWADQPEAVGKFRGKRIFSRLKSKDPARLRLLTDEYKNLTGIQAPLYNGGETFDPADFVVYSHLSWYENPAGTSDFRAAYGPYYRKRVVTDLWSIHLDKFTGGMLKGTYTDAATQKAALEAALEEARANTWITVPVGTLVESMQFASGGQNAEFEAFCRYQDEQSLIAIVGAYLHILTGVKADRGDTSISKETSELFQWMLAATLAGSIQKQLVVPLTLENYSDVEPPGVTLGSISEATMQQRAIVDAALQAMGLPLSKKEAYSFYGRNAPDDDADTLVPPVAPPAPGGFGEGGPPKKVIPFPGRRIA